MKRVLERIIGGGSWEEAELTRFTLLPTSYCTTRCAVNQPRTRSLLCCASLLSRVTAVARRWSGPTYALDTRLRRPLKVRPLSCAAFERVVESIIPRRSQPTTARLTHALLQSTWTSTQTLTTCAPLFVSQFRAVSAPKSRRKIWCVACTDSNSPDPTRLHASLLSDST